MIQFCTHIFGLITHHSNELVSDRMLFSINLIMILLWSLFTFLWKFDRFSKYRNYNCKFRLRKHAQIHSYLTFLSALLILFTEYRIRSQIDCWFARNRFGYAASSDCNAADRWQCIKRSAFRLISQNIQSNWATCRANHMKKVEILMKILTSIELCTCVFDSS